MSKKENADVASAFGKPYQTSLLLKCSGITASIVVILAGIHAARSILGPFLMAVFFTVLLITPINWLKKKGFSSVGSLTLVIIAVAVCGVGAATIAGGQLAQFARSIPDYRDRFDATLQEYNLRIDDFLPSFLKSDDNDETPQDERKEREKEEDAAEETEKDASRAQTRRAANEDESQESGAKRAGESSADAKNAENQDAGSKDSGKKDSGQKDAAASGAARESKPNVTQATYLTPARNLVAEALIETTNVEVADSEGATTAARNAEDYLDGAFNENERSSILPGEPQDRLTPSVNETGISAEFGANDAFFGDDANVEEDDQNDVVPRANVGEPVSITAVNASSSTLFRFLTSLAGELSYIASSAFLVTLLLIFMLIETSKIPEKLVAAIGRRRFVNSHIENVIADIRNYMVIKTEMSLLVGCLVTILTVATKVQYPLLWGFVAFLLNYIPNIGSTVAAIPPIVLATIDRGMFIGCIDCVGLVVINCVVGYVLEPKLLGKGLDLSPLIVLIALIFFGWLLGPVGMFLSPPLAVVMKIIFNAFPETRWIAALMANKPPKSRYSD